MGPRPRPDRYGTAGFLLLLSVLAFALAPANAWGRLAALAVEGVTLVFILSTSLVNGRVLRLATVMVLFAFALALALAATNHAVALSTGLIGASIVLMAPVAIVKRLLRQERITGSTIAGAICLYLLAGLFFALLYAAADSAAAGRFFSQHPARDPTNYVYFSFVTISTLGYGDLTPAARLGKLLAVTEAVGGQLYLVTIVTVLVSNIGHARTPRGRE